MKQARAGVNAAREREEAAALPDVDRGRPIVASDVTLAIDCMGGDHGPAVTVPAALRFLESNPAAGVILVGLRDARSEERRVGKECHVVCRSRWSPYH